MDGVNSDMKIKLKNESTIETIDLDSENIRSKRGEQQLLQHYNQYIDEILKSFELKWYQKFYLKVRRRIRKPYIWVSSKYKQ